MNLKNIILIKLNGREVLTKANGEFLEFSKDKTNNEIIDFVKAEINEEIKFSEIILEDKRSFDYYGKEQIAISINIQGFSIKKELTKFKILNVKRDKIDNIYGCIIDELYREYRYYTGVKTKKYTIQKEEEIKINRMDLVFSIIFGALMTYFIITGESLIFEISGIWIPIMYFLVVGYAIVVKKVKLKNKFGLFLVVAGLILSLAYGIFANPVLREINNIVVPISIFFGIKLLVKKEKDIKIISFIKEAIVYTFFRPFKRVLNSKIISLFSYNKESNNKKQIKDIIIGLIISIPVLIILGNILSGANSVFGDFLNGLLSFNINTSYVIYGIIFIVLTIYMIGLTKGISVVFEDKEKKTEKSNINITILNTVLVMINLLYVSFVAISLKSSGANYSQMARSGFFQLMFVVFINIVLIVLFSKEVEESVQTKFLFTLIIILSLCMSINSIIQIRDYVLALGLTRLRFLSGVGTIFLMIVLGILLINNYKKFKIWYYVIIIGVIMYVGLNYCNMDNIIAKYNISKYKSSQQFSSMDLQVFLGLSADAKYTLRKAEKEGIFEKITENKIKNIKPSNNNEYDYNDYESGENYEKLNAEHNLKVLKNRINGYFKLDTNGKIFQYNYYN